MRSVNSNTTAKTIATGGFDGRDLASRLQVGGVGDILKAHRASMSKSLSVTTNVSGGTSITSADRQFPISLEAPAKLLKSPTSPLRNRLPRNRPTPASCDISWKIIDNWNKSARATVNKDDCGTGTAVIHDSKTVLTQMKSLRANSHVSACNVEASRDFDDLIALGKLLTLYPLWECEEDLLWGGQETAISAPANLASAGPIPGGSLPNGTYDVKVTALTMEGFRDSEAAGYAGAGSGESVVSAALGPQVAALNDQIVVTWDDVPEAVAFNVYVDLGGGGFFYEETVQVNTITLTNALTPGNAEPGADTSADPNAFTGILGYLAAFGAPVTDFGGAKYTSSPGQKSLEEWLAVFQTIYSTDKTGPEEIWMSPGVWADVIGKIGGSSSPVYQVNLDPTGAGSTGFTGGLKIDAVLNPFTGEMVRLIAHPNFPAGLVVGLRHSAPFDVARLGGPAIDVATLMDYASVDLARTDACFRWYIETCEVLRMRSTLGCFAHKNVGC